MGFNDSLCHAQLDYFNASLSRRDFWAMRMLDTYAKLPPGILYRNVRQFGLFDECLNFKYLSTDEKVGDIQGQYCTITHVSRSNGIPSDNDRLEWRDIGILARNQNLRFESGICIPDSCSEDRAKFFANSILKNADLTAIAAFCQQNKEIVLSALDYFVLVMLGLFLLIIITSTIYEIWTKKKSQGPKKLFTIFSLNTNLKELLHIDYRKSRNVISCMHGMRALAAFWIISGHRIFRDSRYMSRPLNPSNIAATATLALLMTVDYAVDIFFLLSAILVAQSCLRALDGKKLNLGKIYFNRYMRYTPAVTVLLLFMLSFLPYAFVNGPSIRLLTTNVERCQKYWWSTLLMIQNYVNVDQVCLGHVWYLCADFQLYLMSPIFVYVAWKFRFKSFWLFGAILAAVQISIFFVRFYDTVKEEVVYRQTHYRIGQWLVGISLGYIMYQMKDESSEYQIKKRIRCICWLLTTTALISTEIYYQLLRTEPLPRAFYEATHRIVFTCFIGWMIFSFHHLKSGHFIRKFLSHPLWQPISKLSLSIYLVHDIYIILSVSNIKDLSYFDMNWMLHIIAGDIVMTIFYSIVLYLLIEAPITKLLNLYFK